MKKPTSHQLTSMMTIAGVVLLLALAVLFGLLGKPTEMALIIVASAIALAFINIDRIQKFKGGGFEAEMREVIKEASATIDQLRDVACAGAEPTLTSLMAGNFMSGISLEMRLESHDRLILKLQEIGASTSQVAVADALWKKGIGMLYHRGAKKLIEHRQKGQMQTNVAPGAREAGAEFQKMLRFETWDAPSSTQMREFVISKGLMTNELQELLDDYLHFEKTGALQRREVFTAL
jgi:hypothetical protein